MTTKKPAAPKRDHKKKTTATTTGKAANKKPIAAKATKAVGKKTGRTAGAAT